MANKYYTPSGEPVDLSRARAVQLRAEFASIEQGFALLQIDTDRAVKLRQGETVEILDEPSVRAGGVFAFDSSGNLVVFGKASDASRAGKILGWDATTGTLKYWDYASTITSPVNAAAASAASAAQSATNAAASASAAAQSEATVAASAAAAAQSEDNAAASASAAAQSEANAAASEASAAQSATNAAASASAAEQSATNAAASAAAAAQSATDSAASASAAAASFDAFDGRYLGAKASDPTTDNDGNALITGALYWNTTANEMRVWDGASWKSAAASFVGSPETAQELAGGVDLNTVTTPGFYVQSLNVDAASGTNYPVPLAGSLMVLKNSLGVSQIYYTYGSSARVFFRALYNNSWSSWKEIYHSGNISTANAGTATKLQTARTLTIGNTGKGFDGSSDVSWSLDEIGAARFAILPSGYDLNRVVSSGFYRLGVNHLNAPVGVNSGQLIVAHGGSGTILQIVTGYSNDEIYWRQGNPPDAGGSGSWYAWRRFYHSGNISTANAGTATKLQTARTINIGNTGKSFDGSANVSWTLDEIGAAKFASLPSGYDLNIAVSPGFYRLGASHLNAPVGVNYGQLIVARGGGDTILQIVTGYNNDEIYWRQGNPTNIGGVGSWYAWRKFYHSGNLPGWLSTNGYQKLPGGLIIQWGFTTVSTVTFPVAFPNAVLNASATKGVNTADNPLNTAETAVGYVTKTGMGVFAYKGGDIMYQGVMWIAIGY